ncbi:receptor-like protein 6 [Quercus suber]|uniref:receptor-like protein 6 n=1 Tax=Quercus suber TaxID=58331 RepID=UPI0032E04D51
MSKELENNWLWLKTSIECARWLAFQACAFRGHDESLDSKNKEIGDAKFCILVDEAQDESKGEQMAIILNLTTLCLSFCGISGQFPKHIFQVPTLQMIDLSNNYLLQGSLPEFHPNGSLQSLLLHETKFSGTLPDSIGNLKMLSRIDLSFCNFNGSIPSSIANLTQLVYLDISSNNFTGPVPSFNMAKNMTKINLSFNNLTGQITFTHWEDLQSLVELILCFNLLEGDIPTTLFSLPLLLRLELSNNQFSGQLHEFSNVSSFLLQALDLSNNNLEGPIPMSVLELRGLQTLQLSSNNFSGSFQLDVFQQLRNLSMLDLSYNSLLIEHNRTNYTFDQIVTLQLASCKLKTFPNFWINHTTLLNLDLSNNQIHGEIPNWTFTQFSYYIVFSRPSLQPTLGATPNTPIIF